MRTKTKYIGFNKPKGKWQIVARINGRPRFGGYYPTEAEAIQALPGQLARFEAEALPAKPTPSAHIQYGAQRRRTGGELQ